MLADDIKKFFRGDVLTDSATLAAYSRDASIFTEHMNHIRSVTADTAVLEPGVYYRDFEKEADKFGVMLPSYPASKELCAIGGIVSNNSGGEKTLVYGIFNPHKKAQADLAYSMEHISKENAT
jgi:FAD/FMN-containing dehydrogenase